MDALLLVVSLSLVTIGAELLVRGAVALALRLGLSALFVGLTIVGFGTSSPELASSLTATARGSIDVSVGNVVGSNLFNVAVILGLTSLLRPIAVQFRAVKRDLFVAIGAACVPFLAVFGGGTIGQVGGAVLITLLVLYLVSSYWTARASAQDVEAVAHAQVESTVGTTDSARHANWLSLGLVVSGLLLLVVGSRIFVSSAIELATAAGVSELVIGLTIVSAGTSLPELVTSLVAARRGNADIAIGNVLGSNIFNGFGILGVCAAMKGQAVSPWVLRMDAPLVLVASLALLPIVRSGARITRGEGVALLVGYGAYLVALFWRA